MTLRLALLKKNKRIKFNFINLSSSEFVYLYKKILQIFKHDK